jgi:hypothetical protein
LNASTFVRAEPTDLTNDSGRIKWHIRYIHPITDAVHLISQPVPD